MDNPHILVMTPCFGGSVSAIYAASMLDLLRACEARKLRIEWDLRPGGSSVIQARGNGLDAFLRHPTATHLLFIDADIGFHPAQVFRLLDFDAEFSCATYPLKELDWPRMIEAIKNSQGGFEPARNYTYVLGAGTATKPVEIIVHQQFARVDYAGMGFVMIQRAAVLKMMAAYALRSGRDVSLERKETAYTLFTRVTDPVNGLYLSEGNSFCTKWRLIGGDIWVDTQSRLTHVGPIALKGDLFAQVMQVPEND